MVGGIGELLQCTFCRQSRRTPCLPPAGEPNHNQLSTVGIEATKNKCSTSQGRSKSNTRRSSDSGKPSGRVVGVEREAAPGDGGWLLGPKSEFSERKRTELRNAPQRISTFPQIANFPRIKPQLDLCVFVCTGCGVGGVST